MSNINRTKSTSFNINKEPEPIGPSIKMKTETARKIGLFGAVAIIIGSVFGVGIFLKNKSVFFNNNGNPLGVLLSWSIVFIIAFATAFSYGEITRVKTKTTNSGLSGWGERYVGYNYSRFLKIMYPSFYYAVYYFAITMYFVETLFCINPNCIINGAPLIIGQNMWMLWWIGFAIAIFSLFANWLNSYLVQKSMSFISPVKFIPILLVIAFGVWGGMKSHGGLFNKNNYPVDTYSGEFTLSGIFVSLPAIMFAFDSFLILGNISSNIKNPTKNVPISIIISMIIAGVFYLLVTISQLFCGVGNPYGLFEKLFKDNEKLRIIFVVIISSLMSISLLGNVVSKSSAFINSTQVAIEEELIIGSIKMKKINNRSSNKLSGAFIMSVSIISFWYLVFGIISAILSTDQIFDGLSNIAVVLIFLMYGFVAFMSVVNRFTNKVSQSEVPHQKGQVPLAIIAALGCFLIPIYQMVYEFIIKVIQNPMEDFKAWGLFWKGEHIKRFMACIIFWGGAIIFIVWPFINDLLIKVTNKNYKQPLLWEKVKKHIEIKK